MVVTFPTHGMAVYSLDPRKNIWCEDSRKCAPAATTARAFVAWHKQEEKAVPKASWWHIVRDHHFAEDERREWHAKMAANYTKLHASLTRIRGCASCPQEDLESLDRLIVSSNVEDYAYIGIAR